MSMDREDRLIAIYWAMGLLQGFALALAVRS